MQLSEVLGEHFNRVMHVENILGAVFEVPFMMNQNLLREEARRIGDLNPLWRVKWISVRFAQFDFPRGDHQHIDVAQLLGRDSTHSCVALRLPFRSYSLPTSGVSRSAFLQLQRLLRRFGPCLLFMRERLKLLLVVGTDARHRLFTRLLRHPNLQKLLPDIAKVLEAGVRVYRVQRAVPTVCLLVPEDRHVAELRMNSANR
jgi:hypothetical protein